MIKRIGIKVEKKDIQKVSTPRSTRFNELEKTTFLQIQTKKTHVSDPREGQVSRYPYNFPPVPPKEKH